MPSHASPAAAPLGRSDVDRAAAERDVPDVIQTALRSPETRILALAEGRAALAPDGPALHFASPDDVAASSVLALLGREESGAAVLLALLDEAAADRLDPPGGWGELRVIGGELPGHHAALFVEALSLARWLRDAAYCSFCGTLTDLRQAGWSRTCPSCGRQHFPRTDPAVIVAVTDQSGERLLLGANAAWGGARYSCFAGFVEAGESAESTIVREIEEESGVSVTDVQYIGSQAWPYPRSLMLGYLATAVDADAARPDGVEIVDVRWFTAAEIGAALAGEADFGLPGSSSIARMLIERWHAQATRP